MSEQQPKLPLVAISQNRQVVAHALRRGASAAGPEGYGAAPVDVADRIAFSEEEQETILEIADRLDGGSR
jgi:hypothetical protein